MELKDMLLKTLFYGLGKIRLLIFFFCFLLLDFKDSMGIG